MSALVPKGDARGTPQQPLGLCKGLKVLLESPWAHLCVRSSPTLFGLVTLSCFLLVLGQVTCVSTADLFSATQFKVMKKIAGLNRQRCGSCHKRCRDWL